MKKAIKFMSSAVIITLSCNRTTQHDDHIRIFSKVYPPANYKIVGAIINGQRNGLWITYDSLGRVEKEETFINGRNFGQVNYFTNGDLTARTIDTIIKNDTISNYEQYNEYKKLIVKGQYVNGRQKGIWTYYHNSGKGIKSIVDYQEKNKKVKFIDTNKFKTKRDNY